MKDLDDAGVAGIAGPIPLGDVLFMARKANRLGPLQVVRADRVMDLDHIQSAWNHARRSLEEGRALAKRPELEFLRYMACAKTIDDALARMGLPDPVGDAIVIALGPNHAKTLPYFVDLLGAIEKPALLKGNPAAAEALVDSRVRESMPGRDADLVLQAVAEVDTLK